MPAELSRLETAAVGCTNDPQTFDHLASGTFGGGKAIALNYWSGRNTTVEWAIDAYADVPPGTAAIFSLSGPQQWTCSEVFTTPQHVPIVGDGLFQTDQDRKAQRIAALPMFTFGLRGPSGAWKMTIDIPSINARFSHTWKLWIGDSVDTLYDVNPRCRQTATTLVQQKRFAQTYLDALHDMFNSPSETSRQPGATQMRQMVNQALSAKLRGDTEPTGDARAADYGSAASTLMSLAQFAAADVGLAPYLKPLISGFSNSAASLLLQTGLA